MRPIRRLLLFLTLVGLACAMPGALQPTALPPTRPPVAPTLPAAQPGPAATSSVSRFSGEAVSGAVDQLSPANPFAPFSAVARPALEPGLSRDQLNDLEKLPSLQQLSASQRDALLEHGYVISTQPFDTFAAAYSYGADQKLPAYVTIDTILHAFRVVTDVAWQRSEALFLRADLQALSDTMVTVSHAQWEEAQDDATAEAARRNTAFFAVASSLMDAAFTPPSLVAQTVADELTLVRQGGRFISPLFAVEVDYSQFEPDGRYAQDEALAQYYQALSWLGQPFSFAHMPAGNDALGPLVQARLAARQALLMTWGLQNSDNLSRWERIFVPSLYFRGTDVAWSVTPVQVVSEILYGQPPAVADLGNDALLDDFLATMHTMPPALPFDPAPQLAFALLPSPARESEPDDLIMRQLVFNRIGAYTGDRPLPRTAIETAIGPIRALPRTLDVAAALGSSRALAEITSAGDHDYEAYDLQMQQLRSHYEAIEPAAWANSFDGGWLFALQPLLEPSSDEGFLYAPVEAAETRQLAGWHAGWLSMRHETALAPRAVAAITISPDVAYGFLEPQPLLYGRLASLAAQILNGLGSRGLLDRESTAKLQQLERLLDAARTIARKELENERLSADEAQLLGEFITRLQNITTYEPALGTTVPQDQGNLPFLVDVYLDSSSGKLLQAASGEAWPVYVLVPREEGIMLTMGAILSTYELHGEQLAPAAWRDLANRPPPPSWLQPYIVPD